MEKSQYSLMKTIGPGILFAGAAIGVSHLVQATRAGAVYGLGLVGFILVANLFKYASFRFGPHYATATGQSLVEGYRLRGKWVVAVFGAAMLPSLAIIIAAISITTAGMANAVLGLNLPDKLTGVGLVAVSIVFLYTGGYKWLDRFSKIFVAILTVATLAATIIALPRIDWSFYPSTAPALDLKSFSFIIALMGFMPAAMDLSVITSAWAVAKQKATGYRPSLSESALDFNIGYIGTTVLALCFLLMGAGVMHASGTALADGSVAFADQIVGLYRSTLGDWSAFLVGMSALMIIFTTLIAVMDGMPRVIASAYITLKNESGRIDEPLDKSKTLLVTMILMGITASLILLYLMSSFKQFIDLTTMLAFFLAPFIAILNHLSVNGPEVPTDLRPAKWLNVWSLVGIATMIIVSLIYVYSLVFMG